MAGIVELEVEYQRLVAQRELLGARYEAGETTLLPEIKALNQQIRVVLIQLDNLKAINSSGQVVREDQRAQTENANPVNPGGGAGQLLVLENGRVKLAPDTTTGTNAIPSTTPETSVNSGLDAPVRTLVETQGTPPGGAGSPGVAYQVNGYGTVNEDAFIGGNFTGLFGNTPQPGGQAGRGALGDDSGKPTGAGTSAVVTELNSINFTEERLIPQDNVLDNYTSYTYEASLYLMTKDTYQRMINTGEKNLSGAALLVRSGGAGNQGMLDLDYYIDRLELKSFFAGKSVRLAHNVKEVKMTVVEPTGISFIEKIDSTVQTFFGGSAAAKKKNFTSQIYLLVIRFYGYDEQGNLVRSGTVPGQTVTTSNAAAIEKWYPLILTKVNFKAASKLVEYDLEFKAPPYQIGAGTKHASIPFNVELSGGTLKDILAGPAVYSAGQAATNQTSATAARTGVNLSNAGAGGGRGGATTYQAPPKADAANTPKKTVRQGLMAALNQWQQDLKNQGVYEFADEYNVEFALDSMANATIFNPGLNKGATSMSVPTTAGEQKLGSKQSMDPKSRVEGATAGMQIVQFIDTLVRNSSYIRDQQLVVIDEKTGNKNPTGVKVKNTAWYKISFRAEAKMNEYDEKRNDYAYKITYVISPFKISQLNSPYFEVPKFNGTHKKYNYWFTGENTQILSYEETLNSLYYVILSGANLGGASSNANELLKYQYQTASGQSTQGAEGKTVEPSANAADQLYNPADLKECTMQIVGDPAWLQQGEAFVGLRKGAKDYYSAFLNDGTINFDSQQILFEIGYNTSKDYNLETGAMDINRGIYKTTEFTPPEYAQTSRIYIAKECLSEFSRGKFTQTLKGSLMVYYPQGKGEGRPSPNQIASRNATVVAAQTKTKAPSWPGKVAPLAPGNAADAAKIPESMRGKDNSADVFRPVLQQIDPKTLLPIKRLSDNAIVGYSTVVNREF